MYYEKSSAKWILQSLHMPQKYIQTLERLPEELPIGTHNWQITMEDAMCGLKANESMELTISQCYPNMYTCNNGDCIELRYSDPILNFPFQKLKRTILKPNAAISLLN